MAATAERLVLDASYAIEAVLPTSGAWQLEAFDLMDRIAGGVVDAQVPWLFFAELAGVVTRSVRGRRLDAAAGADFLQHVDALGLQVDPAEAHGLALHQAAMRWHAGASDAIYLDLAERLAVPIATRDRGMASAAHAAGVAVY